MVFDLTPLATELDRNYRSQRLMTRAVAMFFAIALVVGVYLLSFPPANHAPNFYVGPLLLVIVSALICIQWWVGSATFGHAPTRLELTSKLAAFQGSPGQKAWLLSWSDPKLRFGIIDRTRLPRVRYDGRPQIIDYIVKAPRRPQTPVPREVFDAILEQAAHHGLRVTRSETKDRMGRPETLTTISAPRRN